MDHRPQKSRPSNIITYVLLSIAALFGLFILGKVLQSLNSGSVAPGQENSHQIARSHQEIDVL